MFEKCQERNLDGMKESNARKKTPPDPSAQQHSALNNLSNEPVTFFIAWFVKTTHQKKVRGKKRNAD